MGLFPTSAAQVYRGILLLSWSLIASAIRGIVVGRLAQHQPVGGVAVQHVDVAAAGPDMRGLHRVGVAAQLGGHGEAAQGAELAPGVERVGAAAAGRAAPHRVQGGGGVGGHRRPRDAVPLERGAAAAHRPRLVGRRAGHLVEGRHGGAADDRPGAGDGAGAVEDGARGAHRPDVGAGGAPDGVERLRGGAGHGAQVVPLKRMMTPEVPTA